MKTYQTIQLEQENDILVIINNRPEKLNAINQLFLQELKEVIEDLYINTNFKSAIIIGSGEKSFAAGADITEFLQIADGGEVTEKGQHIFNLIENCPKPIVACVNGFALGGGSELALACHLRIASENATFAQPEINLGIIPGWGGTQRLTQLIGKAKALEYMLTGNMINAQQALSWGLVNYVVPIKELKNKAITLLTVINGKSQNAVAATLEAFNSYYDKDKNGFKTEIESFKKIFKTPNSIEGITAFLEKRKPQFK
ncbi:MAG: enoyl-CoA hydratase-related protein [Sediminibacterium sp.]|nr:enoyl-CoA hydratase-related protein [Sediminibacterium sp.]